MKITSRRYTHRIKGWSYEKIYNREGLKRECSQIVNSVILENFEGQNGYDSITCDYVDNFYDEDYNNYSKD